MKLTVAMRDNARQIIARVGRKPIRVQVFGKRDPRGYDNSILIWVDHDDDTLHIMVPKMENCYRFSHYVDHGGAVEFVAK
jgi:hypothetical protein